MVYEKEDKLIRQIENQKYRGVKPIVEELNNRIKDLDIIEQQKFVNNLYRNLSDYGVNKLDKVINMYNKSHEPLKTNDEIQKECQEAANKAITLFEQYGTRYGEENVDVDDFIREQYKEIMSALNPDNIQDTVDIISKNVKEEDKDTFSMVTKEYGNKNHLRIRISNFAVAQAQAEELAKRLEFDKDGLSPEQLEAKKAEIANDFKFAMLEAAKVMLPDDFQMTINILDKQLDYDGRNAIDSAIKLNNRKNNDKFETRRIKLSEAEKDKSWQRIESETVFDRKFREFRERLAFIMRDKELKDKYDTGAVNAMLHMYTRLQDLIGEVGIFIKNTVDYFSKNKSEKSEEECKEKVSPFYSVMRDAYQEKGKELAEMLNSGTIDKATAEKLFIMDVSYIRSQDAIKQNELFSIYANSLSDAMKQPDISIECKNTIMEFISKYERGIYEDQIKDNIEKGCDWSKVHSQKKEKQKEPETEKTGDKSNDAPKSKQQEYRERIMKSEAATLEIRNIGKDVALGDYKTADEQMAAFVKAVGKFAHNHPEMNTEQINQYAKIGISAMFTYQDKNQDLINNMSQFNDKYFTAGNDKDMAYSILVGASKVEAANKCRVENNEPIQQNILRNDFTNAVEQAMSTLKNNDEKQNFFSSISNMAKTDVQKYMLAEEARKHECNARVTRGLDTYEKVRRETDMVAEKYIRNARSHSNMFSAKQGLIALCERIPSDFGEQRVYDMIKSRLANNKEALKTLNQDVEQYNKSRAEWHDTIINTSDARQEQRNTSSTRDTNTQQNAKTTGNEKSTVENELGQMKKNNTEELHESIPNIDVDLDAEMQEIYAEDQRQMQVEISTDTLNDLIDAFNTDDRPIERFSQWINGKTQKEIQNAVTEIDNNINNSTGCMRLMSAIQANDIYAKAPNSESQVYESGIWAEER